jgi:hypothetical protein
MPEIIPISSIEEGMVSAEPIINNYGQTLIPAGATLSNKHKVLLMTWNIDSICIKTEESGTDMEISDEVKALAMERLARRFKWTPRNSLEKELFSIALLHTSKQILRNK